MSGNTGYHSLERFERLWSPSAATGPAHASLPPGPPRATGRAEDHGQQQQMPAAAAAPAHHASPHQLPPFHEPPSPARRSHPGADAVHAGGHHSHPWTPSSQHAPARPPGRGSSSGSGGGGGSGATLYSQLPGSPMRHRSAGSAAGAQAQPLQLPQRGSRPRDERTRGASVATTAPNAATLALPLARSRSDLPPVGAAGAAGAGAAAAAARQLRGSSGSGSSSSAGALAGRARASATLPRAHSSALLSHAHPSAASDVPGGSLGAAAHTLPRAHSHGAAQQHQHQQQQAGPGGRHVSAGGARPRAYAEYMRHALLLCPADRSAALAVSKSDLAADVQCLAGCARCRFVSHVAAAFGAAPQPQQGQPQQQPQGQGASGQACGAAAAAAPTWLVPMLGGGSGGGRFKLANLLQFVWRDPHSVTLHPSLLATLSGGWDRDGVGAPGADTEVSRGGGDFIPERVQSAGSDEGWGGGLLAAFLAESLLCIQELQQEVGDCARHVDAPGPVELESAERRVKALLEDAAGGLCALGVLRGDVGRSMEVAAAGAGTEGQESGEWAAAEEEGRRDEGEEGEQRSRGEEGDREWAVETENEEGDRHREERPGPAPARASATMQPQPTAHAAAPPAPPLAGAADAQAAATHSGGGGGGGGAAAAHATVAQATAAVRAAMDRVKAAGLVVPGALRRARGAPPAAPPAVPPAPPAPHDGDGDVPRADEDAPLPLPLPPATHATLPPLPLLPAPPAPHDRDGDTPRADEDAPPPVDAALAAAVGQASTSAPPPAPPPATASSDDVLALVDPGVVGVLPAELQARVRALTREITQLHQRRARIVAARRHGTEAASKRLLLLLLRGVWRSLARSAHEAQARKELAQLLDGAAAGEEAGGPVAGADADASAPTTAPPAPCACCAGAGRCCVLHLGWQLEASSLRHSASDARAELECVQGKNGALVGDLALTRDELAVSQVRLEAARDELGRTQDRLRAAQAAAAAADARAAQACAAAAQAARKQEATAAALARATQPPPVPAAATAVALTGGVHIPSEPELCAMAERGRVAELAAMAEVLERGLSRVREARVAAAAAERDACPVCWEERRGVVFGCGHSTCAACGEKLATCPICRVAISIRIRTYV
ncbi:hypothetical protein FOA52_012575 [Chlamydomonas sp. UWO 241]|nr:hypothetical protein FOA52_012575 [Chlamydomonas sp. UWO 241]